MTTTAPTADPEVVGAIDEMLRLVSVVRAEKARDPMRRLEDRLLEMRAAVSE